MCHDNSGVARERFGSGSGDDRSHAGEAQEAQKKSVKTRERERLDSAKLRFET